MKLHYHKHINIEKWKQLSVFGKMANVYAEIGRAINWKNKKRDNLSKNAFLRAIELLDLTIETEKKNSYHLKELCRVKELLVDYFLGENIYKSNDQLWENYFHPFAVAFAKEKYHTLNRKTS